MATQPEAEINYFEEDGSWEAYLDSEADEYVKIETTACDREPNPDRLLRLHAFPHGDRWGKDELRLFNTHCHDLSLDEFKQRFLRHEITWNEEELKELISSLPHDYADWITDVERPHLCAQFAKEHGHYAGEFYQYLGWLLRLSPAALKRKTILKNKPRPEATADMVETEVWGIGTRLATDIDDDEALPTKRTRFAENVQLYTSDDQASEASDGKLNPQSVDTIDILYERPSALRALYCLVKHVMHALHCYNTLMLIDTNSGLRLRLPGGGRVGVIAVSNGSLRFADNYSYTLESASAPLIIFACSSNNDLGLCGQVKLWARILCLNLATIQARHTWIKQTHNFDAYAHSNTVFTIACHGRHAHVTCARFTGKHTLRLIEDEPQDTKGLGIDLYRSPHFRIDKADSLHQFATLVHQILSQIVHEIELERGRA